MKRFLAALAGAVLLSSSAFAADLPPAPVYRAPPPVPPPPPTVNWSGCNLNGGWGYGMYNADSNLETTFGLVPITIPNTAGGRGWLGRFGGGCDFEFPAGGLGNFVVGAFADYDVMNIHGNLDGVVGIGELKESSAWYVGGRVGYLVTPNLLTYFDGGYTQTRMNGVSLFGSTAPFALADTLPSHNFHGWFLGSGLEYALNFSWLPIHGLFWRNEYRFASFDTADLPASNPAGAPAGFSARVTPYNQTITSSLVWRFP